MRKEPGSVYDKWTYPLSFVIIPEKCRAHLKIDIYFLLGHTFHISVGLCIGLVIPVVYWLGGALYIHCIWHCPNIYIKVANQLYGDSEAGTVQLFHYLLNVNVSHFKADTIFVRNWLLKIVLFCVLNPRRWPI